MRPEDKESSMRRTLGTLRRPAALLAAAPRRGSADRWQRAAAGSSVAKDDASETVRGTAAAPSAASRDKRWQRVAQESSPAAEDGPESVGSFIPGVSDDPIEPEETATVRSPPPRWRPDPSQQRHRRHAPPPKPSSRPPSQQPQQQQRRQPPSASPSSPVLRNRFVAAAMQDDDLRRPSTTTPAPAPIAVVHIRLRYLYRLSPVGVVGCAAVGLANGSFWGLGLFFFEAGYFFEPPTFLRLRVLF